MSNIYGYYTRDILLNEKKIKEIREIHLDSQRPRSAVHSVGST